MTTYTFNALFNIPAAHQKLVVDSVVWAFRHTERNIAETVRCGAEPRLSGLSGLRCGVRARGGIGRGD